MGSDKKKIYINGRFLTKKMTGTNRFAYEVCLALHRMTVPFTMTILVPGQPDPEYDLESFHIQKTGGFSSHLWEQVTLPLFLLGKKSLLLSFCGLGPLFNKEQICTIHDLSFLENPEWFSHAYYWVYKLMTPVLARRARKILTVSEFSKGEIIRKLNICPEKILVVYNGISEGFQTMPRTEESNNIKQACPYILTVSSIDPRKNIPLLLRAFQQMDTDIPLYIIGEENPVFRKMDMADAAPNVHFLGRVPDVHLYHWYANASLFIYPSLYEGFGLPPLEALACGCKNVLVSDIPVFREIYGNHVSYVSCSSAEELAIAIKFALKKQPVIGYADNLKSRFSWKETARKIVKSIEICQ